MKVGRDIGARITVPIQLNIEKEHKIRGLEIHFCICPNEKYSKCKDQFVVLPELDTKKCFHAPTQTATAKSVNSSELVILKLCQKVGRALKSKLIQLKRQKTILQTFTIIFAQIKQTRRFPQH